MRLFTPQLLNRLGLELRYIYIACNFKPSITLNYKFRLHVTHYGVKTWEMLIHTPLKTNYAAIYMLVWKFTIISMQPFYIDHFI